MVVDHLAKPHIKDQSFDDWLPQLQAAAQHDHIFCKLSGMITEADWANWKPADLKPFVEAALEAFGPDRCMYGSDWPVCELAGSYEQVHGALTEVLGPISDDEAHAIFEERRGNFTGLRNDRSPAIAKVDPRGGLGSCGKMRNPWPTPCLRVVCAALKSPCAQTRRWIPFRRWPAARSF